MTGPGRILSCVPTRVHWMKGPSEPQTCRVIPAIDGKVVLAMRNGD